MKALREADVVVLVQPCGRSAHLEFGWAMGSGKPGVILLADGEPELMALMADHICISLDDLVDALGLLQGVASPTTGDAAEDLLKFTLPDGRGGQVGWPHLLSHITDDRVLAFARELYRHCHCYATTLDSAVRLLEVFGEPGLSILTTPKEVAHAP